MYTVLFLTALRKLKTRIKIVVAQSRRIHIVIFSKEEKKELYVLTDYVLSDRVIG